MAPTTGLPFTVMPIRTVTRSKLPSTNSCVPSSGSTHTQTSSSVTLESSRSACASVSRLGMNWRLPPPTLSAAPFSPPSEVARPSSPTTVSPGKARAKPLMMHFSAARSACVCGSASPKPKSPLSWEAAIRPPASSSMLRITSPASQASDAAVSRILRSSGAPSALRCKLGVVPGQPSASSCPSKWSAFCTMCTKCPANLLWVPWLSAVARPLHDSGDTAPHMRPMRKRT
mmetsp:Transcript_8855/g.22718  ORF Transcript_8855/g.22718 Transcript_8855/m.22718 type:complete len:230 (+) Transcript_8855:818-1507(+)